MAKTVIIDDESKNRVPYLRGILARSLNSAGLAFHVAYSLASEIRQELDEVDEIRSYELRQMVIKKLEEQGNHKVIERYQATNIETPVIYVECLDGHLEAYSDENFSRLEIIGLTLVETRRVVVKMHKHLIESGLQQIHVNHLGYLTYRCLHQDPLFGPEVADRYLSWVNFARSGCPIILLIGGSAGCGKSTVATALANRLNIVRTQSTDMLREVMRMMIPQRLSPVLHESSFNAWRVLPAAQGAEPSDQDNLLITGYRTQAELLSVPCEAVMQRAIKEKLSLLLEGVHITPSLLDKIEPDDSVIFVQIMLGVLKQKELKKRIMGRRLAVPERNSAETPATFEDIWRLQECLLDEADQQGVPIVQNMHKEETLREVMKIVMNKIYNKFASTPDKVFGNRHTTRKITKITKGFNK